MAHDDGIFKSLSWFTSPSHISSVCLALRLYTIIRRSGAVPFYTLGPIVLYSTFINNSTHPRPFKIDLISLKFKVWNEKMKH